MNVTWPFVVGIALAVLACASPGAFACESDEQCNSGGKGGTCQESGYCSYPDNECASGERYEPGAGGGLGGECVPIDDSTSTGMTTSATSTSGSSEETTVGVEDSGSSDTGMPSCGGWLEPCCGTGCDDGLGCIESTCRCVLDIESGANHVCAIRADASLWCWGSNASGQLGNGIVGGNETDPVLVGLPAGFEPASVSALNHTCAVGNDSRLFCWGQNQSGEVTLDIMGAPVATPFEVDWAGAVAAVGAGKHHTCAGSPDGTVVTCWGRNDDFELGDMGPDPGPYQVPNADFLSVTALGVGGDHSCAALDGDQIACWGRDADGQLGNDLPLESLWIPEFASVGFAADAVVGGSEHTCALGEGQVSCWGSNLRGQVGSAMVMGDSSPVPIGVDVDLPTRIAVGLTHSCALTSGNELWCWGDNLAGQIEPLGPPELLVPARADAFAAELAPDEAVVEIALGLQHSCGLTDDDRIVCLGTGLSGDAVATYALACR